MDVNSAVNQLQDLAHTHPYLALAIILFLLSFLSKNRVMDYLLWFLATLALLKGFGLVDTFFSFLKQVPEMLKQVSSVLGGV